MIAKTAQIGYCLQLKRNGIFGFYKNTNTIDDTLIRSDVVVERGVTSALWMAMIGHKTQLVAAPADIHLLVCDNFILDMIWLRPFLQSPTPTSASWELFGNIRSTA